LQHLPSVLQLGDVVSSLDYSPAGQVTTTIFGNGASITRTYDANAMYRLSRLQTWAQGGTKAQGRRRPHEVQPTLGTICQVSALPFPSLRRAWQLGADLYAAGSGSRSNFMNTYDLDSQFTQRRAD
jgi:hypothetical protein